jgi:hypothetical protein
MLMAQQGPAVQAPFNTSPAYSGTFIPQLWSGKLNVKFYATTVFGEIANTSYEGEIKGMGDTITINNIPTIAISDYTIGQNLNYQVPTPNKVDLNIDQAKYFGVNVSDVLEYQAKPALMSMFTDDATKQMAITIDRSILLAEYNNGAAANKGATAGVISSAVNLGTDAVPVDLAAAADTVLTLILGMATCLDEQNVPDTERWLVIDPATRLRLMRSPLQQAYLTGDDKSILRNGKLGVIDRFTIYLSNQLPKAAAGFNPDGSVNGAGVQRRVILAGHSSALTFAAQITKTESLQNPNDFGQLVRGLNVYGKKMIKPESWVMALVKN